MFYCLSPKYPNLVINDTRIQRLIAQPVIVIYGNEFIVTIEINNSISKLDEWKNIFLLLNMPDYENIQGHCTQDSKWTFSEKSMQKIQ